MWLSVATLANKFRFVYWASGADIVLFTTSARIHDNVQITVGIPIKRVHMKKASVLSESLLPDNTGKGGSFNHL